MPTGASRRGASSLCVCCCCVISFVHFKMRGCRASEGASAVGGEAGALDVALDVVVRGLVDPEGAMEDWCALTHVEAAMTVKDASVFADVVSHLTAAFDAMSLHCRGCPECCNVAAAGLADFVSAVARVRDTRTDDGDWIARRVILLCSLVASVLHLQETTVVLTLNVMRSLDRLIASQIVLGVNCCEPTKAAISNALMPVVCLFVANRGCPSMQASDKLMKTLAWNKPPMAIIGLVLIVQTLPRLGSERDGQAWFRRWWITCWKWLWGADPDKPFVSDDSDFGYKMCACQKTSTVLATLLRRPYGLVFKAMLRDCLDDVNNLTICLNNSVFEYEKEP